MSGKAIFDTLSSEETKEGRDQMVGSVEYVQFTEKAVTGAWQAQWSGASLFGPQTQWSWLLGQREQLQNEIDHGRKYLEQLRKDCTGCGALFEVPPADERDSNPSEPRDGGKHASPDAGMEEFLLGWLARLEKRLGAVTGDIENFQSENRSEAEGPEESVLELLRAAG